MYNPNTSIRFGAPGAPSKIMGPGPFPGGSYLNDTTVFGSWAPGKLGHEFEIGTKQVADFRKALLTALGGTANTPGSTLINFGAMRFQLVRTKLNPTYVATAGNLAFLSNEAQYEVTPDSDGLNAVGVYLWTPTNGDYVLIATYGDCEVRCKAALTNASTSGMALYQVTDSNIGRVDGQAAATAITGTIQNALFGTVKATLVAGQLVRAWIAPKYRLI